MLLGGIISERTENSYWQSQLPLAYTDTRYTDGF